MTTQAEYIEFGVNQYMADKVGQANEADYRDAFRHAFASGKAMQNLKALRLTSEAAVC